MLRNLTLKSVWNVIFCKLNNKIKTFIFNVSLFYTTGSFGNTYIPKKNAFLETQHFSRILRKQITVHNNRLCNSPIDNLQYKVSRERKIYKQKSWDSRLNKPLEHHINQRTCLLRSPQTKRTLEINSSTTFNLDTLPHPYSNCKFPYEQNQQIFN